MAAVDLKELTSYLERIATEIEHSAAKERRTSDRMYKIGEAHGLRLAAEAIHQLQEKAKACQDESR